METPKPPVKTKYWIIIALITATAAGAVIYSANRSQVDLNNPIVKHQQPLDDLKDPQTGTSGWKIYNNDEYGFEMEYPTGYEIQDATEKNKPYIKGLKLLIELCFVEITNSCGGELS